MFFSLPDVLLVLLKYSILVQLIVANVYPAMADQNLTSCPSIELTEEQLQSLAVRRESTFEHCLACEGNVCQLKSWPDEGMQFAELCKVFFCTATKVPRSVLIPVETARSGTFRFSYAIGKTGRVKDIEIVEVTDDLTEKEAIAFAKSAYERRRYRPIQVNKKLYELINLEDHGQINMNLHIKVVK